MTDKPVFDPEITAALLAKRESLNEKHANAKILVYGESGVGKTVETMKIAQAITPKGKTIEFIDFLEGWVSLLNHEGLTERTSRQQFEGLSQLEYLGKAIIAKVPPFDKVGTVIVDELSAMSKSDLDVVLKSRAAKDASKDPSVPTQPDFYSNTERTRRSITTLLSADVNVLVVAHTREDKLNNGRVMTRPAFMPAFSELFRQMMHLVTCLSATEFTDPEDGSTDFRRTFQVHPTQSVSAKTRIGGLPVNVTSDVLIAAIIEWMKGKRPTENIEVEVIHPDTDTNTVDATDDAFAITMD